MSKSNAASAYRDSVDVIQVNKLTFHTPGRDTGNIEHPLGELENEAYKANPKHQKCAALILPDLFAKD